jgi:SAM-dependent methyltransferase
MTDDLTTLYSIYSEDSRKHNNRTHFDLSTVGSEGYGETGYDSMENIILRFIDYFNEDTTFYDLGCGTGKIVYHVGIKYKVKKACGIEFSKERCLIANKIKEKYKVDSNNISVINANILDCDISDATVIYIDNTLFPKNINRKIYEMIPDDCLVITRAKLVSDMNQSDIIKKNLLTINAITEYGGSSLFAIIRKR